MNAIQIGWLLVRGECWLVYIHVYSCKPRQMLCHTLDIFIMRLAHVQIAAHAFLFSYFDHRYGACHSGPDRSPSQPRGT